jgi:hypothetical protein
LGENIGMNIDTVLYHIDRAKDFLQSARDSAIADNANSTLRMLDQVEFHRMQARLEALK